MDRFPVLSVVHDLEFSYPGDDQYVYSVPADLQLAADEIWCIYGVSGSGKSTLMTLLAALRRFESGTLEYRLDDDRVVRVGAESWNRAVGPDLWRRIGFAFQVPELIRSLTVKENLLLAVDPEELEGSLFKESEWSDIAKSPVWQVSGGQIQRLGLMRAFGSSQRLVFLDEPTNNLDRSNRAGAMEFVRSNSRGRGLIVVSHDDDFIHGLGPSRHFKIRDERAPTRRTRRVLEEFRATGIDDIGASQSVGIG